jgi:hypothetical protein
MLAWLMKKKAFDEFALPFPSRSPRRLPLVSRSKAYSLTPSSFSAILMQFSLETLGKT